ncbi:hypothetical protein UFOVP1339_37 [uncultured Caudovirales phage]|uniref:Uncharacterized protein n=1 Tax=uncultured Caudovirales phage TaxID=2100421 RepID=A0A6J5S1I7_9CAUD|nr:hypothetical protein UFOVP1339_37 [uncultured Caudovirales phage]
MTPEQIATIGTLLYGTSWKSAMARALGVDRHTVIGWHEGAWNMPYEKRFALRELAKMRIAELQVAVRSVPKS